MLELDALLADPDFLPDGYDTVASYLRKHCDNEMEVALELGDPRTSYGDEEERVARVSAIVDYAVKKFRYPDGVVCPAFDVRALQVALRECSVPV